MSEPASRPVGCAETGGLPGISSFIYAGSAVAADSAATVAAAN